MKIGVCFKIVPDYEEVPLADWDAMDQLDLTYVKKMYGCFDEAALETALRLRDSFLEMEENVSCTAVTVGGGPEVLLQGLFAAGFDQVVTIPRPEGPAGENLDFLPMETARLLASYWKTQQPDVIFTGRMTGPGDSGLVPAYLAAALGYDLKEDVTEAGCLSAAMRQQTAERGEAQEPDQSPVIAQMVTPAQEPVQQVAQVEIVQRQGDLIACRLVTGPAVLVVGDAACPNLRMFSLKARMEARKRKAACWKPENTCGKPQDPGQALEGGARDLGKMLIWFDHEPREGRCLMVEGGAAEKAAWLRKALSGEVTG